MGHRLSDLGGHDRGGSLCAGQRPLPLPFLQPARRWIGVPPVSHVLATPERGKPVVFPTFDGSEWAAGLNGFLSTRLWEAVTIGLTAPRPTLSLPSTEDGVIAPETLRSRLAELARTGAVPGRFELVQAILRVGPTVDALTDGFTEGLFSSLPSAASKDEGSPGPCGRRRQRRGRWPSSSSRRATTAHGRGCASGTPSRCCRGRFAATIPSASCWIAWWPDRRVSMGREITGARGSVSCRSATGSSADGRVAACPDTAASSSSWLR